MLELQGLVREKLGSKMDPCEILIILPFMIMAVIPLAVVMTLVEVVNKRRIAMQQRNRIGSRRHLNSVSLSTL